MSVDIGIKAKRWKENQVKSSIDYEFSVSLKKDLLDILNGRSDE